MLVRLIHVLSLRLHLGHLPLRLRLDVDVRELAGALRRCAHGHRPAHNLSGRDRQRLQQPHADLRPRVVAAGLHVNDKVRAGVDRRREGGVDVEGEVVDRRVAGRLQREVRRKALLHHRRRHIRLFDRIRGVVAILLHGGLPRHALRRLALVQRLLFRRQPGEVLELHRVHERQVRHQVLRRDGARLHLPPHERLHRLHPEAVDVAPEILRVEAEVVVADTRDVQRRAVGADHAAWRGRGRRAARGRDQKVVTRIEHVGEDRVVQQERAHPLTQNDVEALDGEGPLLLQHRVAHVAADKGDVVDVVLRRHDACGLDDRRGVHRHDVLRELPRGDHAAEADAAAHMQQRLVLHVAEQRIVRALADMVVHVPHIATHPRGGVSVQALASGELFLVRPEEGLRVDQLLPLVVLVQCDAAVLAAHRSSLYNKK
ncbi:arginine N-methyltransferase [Strigomonas culicis]|uniref:Arginine N-methyltransferase n=1 Tax=Strigomonas culicis TaxID=28005 RepID=S9W372_9TRYP|nr:arginine N-methyltransferase [Strigomonas culicis]|eukprot:EPY33796.1 arginine N-methyltransferase [Strigomonas culicis]